MRNGEALILYSAFSGGPKNMPAINKSHWKPMTVISSITALPEIHVMLFSFLLNFVWEMLQVPFFDGMATMPHWQGVKECTVATAGDILISLVCFWIVAGSVRSRNWIQAPSRRQIDLFVASGLVITIGFEFLATRTLDRWEYSETMPTLPVFGTGLVPLLQWIVLPLLLVWFVRRQLKGIQMILNAERRNSHRC
jgi:hypothetical protein